VPFNETKLEPKVCCFSPHVSSCKFLVLKEKKEKSRGLSI
jgi:hypothetical protein